jgi:hypothetical protein
MADKYLKTTKDFRTDAELLMVLSWKDQETDANSAYNELYKRHGKFMKTIVRQVCSFQIYRYGDILKDDVFNNLWVEVHQNPDRLFEKVEKLHDPEEIRLAVRTEMIAIAREQMRYETRMAEERYHRYQLHIVDDETDEINFIDRYSWKNFSEEPEIDEPDVAISADWMLWYEKYKNQVKPRDLEITLAMMDYEVKGCKLPRDVIANLCRRYEVLPGTLRLIKHRTTHKLKSLTNLKL